jgi:uncharacterized protein
MNMKNIGQKILYFPLARIIIGLIVCGGIVLTGVRLLQKATDFENDFINLTGAIVLSLLAMGTYSLLYRYYEKREITEFSAKNIVRHLTLGIAIGAGIQTMVIFIIFLMGGFSFISVNPVLYVLPPLAIAIFSAVFEETISRGIIFRITEEKLGSYIALIISALIFGALHLGNSGLSASGIALVILAGLLLAAAYMYSRNLWLPVAIHFSWNFTLSAVYGATVSGFEMPKTLIITRIEGADWYTGGAFGPEGSIQANVFCLAAAIILLVLCHKHGKIIQPYWKKKNESLLKSTVPVNLDSKTGIEHNARFSTN